MCNNDWSIKGNYNGGFWISTGRDNYLWHDGIIHDTATGGCLNKFEAGWYHTKEEAEKVLNKFLNPVRVPRHGDVVHYKGKPENLRVILLIDGEFSAYNQDGTIVNKDDWIREYAYPEGFYVFIKNIFDKEN